MSVAETLGYSVNDTAVRTTLAEDLTSGETGVDVAEVTNVPSTPFLISVWEDLNTLQEDAMEIMEVTAISGTTLTVNRGQKGTTAQAFSSGDLVFMGVLVADFPDSPGLPQQDKTANPPDTSTADTVTLNLDQTRLLRISRGADGPIEIQVDGLVSGRGAVAIVTVENGGGWNLSVSVSGGSFNWSGGVTPSLNSGTGVQNVLVLQQTGASEVTGFLAEK